jgi:predicted nucleotidyltransferase
MLFPSLVLLLSVVAAAIINASVGAQVTNAAKPNSRNSAAEAQNNVGAAQVQKAERSTVSGEPNLSSWLGDGRAGVVRNSAGKTTQVTPLRGPALATSIAGFTPNWCGARFQTGTAPAQSLVLIGIDNTEALSCSGIKAFGTVAAPRGTERIAFVYRGSSPNASDVNTVVIVERKLATVGARWAVNDALSSKLDERGDLVNIPAIRAYLAGTSERER